MKRLAMFFLTLGFSLSLMAAPKEYFDAVRASEAMRELIQEAGGAIDIIDIREVRSFNCPGCFEFEMRYFSVRSAEIQSTNFQTRDTSFDGPRILVFNK